MDEHIKKELDKYYEGQRIIHEREAALIKKQEDKDNKMNEFEENTIN